MTSQLVEAGYAVREIEVNDVQRWDGSERPLKVFDSSEALSQ
jgi:hypothetical protein